ncbi:proline dehydrogenase family protein [Cohaesibacter sp. ES.047]|uniref:proline dehydrogenase family protein n=1 Tax=Cohaesibacter sp. ES.047 TaxID=1798205 RepID=UPI0012FD651D|nr:proline dehydrogenase family protein [Cohaesibacter sp. ES.047]
MQNNRSTTALAKRYVGGANAVEAMDCAVRLAEQGISSSFFYLGEYVDSPKLVEQNINALQSLINLIEKAPIEGNISVDPTQVGCSIDWNSGAAAFRPLCKALKKAVNSRPGAHCIMIDMEDHSVVGQTVDLHNALSDEGFPVALTLQAYLRRTADDLVSVIARGGRVRLVKGAFVAGGNIAYVGERAVKANYYRLIDLMLSKEARDNDFCPVFGTHDHEIHAYVIEKAAEMGWSKGSYEFEMLYGARDDVAADLARRGEAIRLYLPFGSDWWPYAIRRIGENPKNLMLLMRSLL